MAVNKLRNEQILLTIPRNLRKRIHEFGLAAEMESESAAFRSLLCFALAQFERSRERRRAKERNL